jgi:hypothetical protein
MRRTFWGLICSFFVSIFFWGADLPAQETAPDRGFVWGAKIGPSLFYDRNFFLKETDYSVGLGLNLFTGAALNDRFALLGFIDLHWAREDVGSAVAQVVNLFLGPLAHYFFTDRWWVRAGPGFVIHLSRAQVDLSYADEVGHDRGGFGAFLGVGYEFLRKGPVSIGASLQFMPQWFRPSEGGLSLVVAGGMGVFWF